MIGYRTYIRRTVRGALAAAACWCVLCAPYAFADSREPTEQQVKAAYLYNFAKFVDWPSDAFSGPDAPVVFGILGDDPFGSIIDAVTARTVNGRRTKVIRYRALSEIRTCHVLFISDSEQGRLGGILKALRRSGILLVSDIRDFAARGGMIGFIETDGTIGFEINPDAVARAGLTVNSRLLNISDIVQEERPPHE